MVVPRFTGHIMIERLFITAVAVGTDISIPTMATITIILIATVITIFRGMATAVTMDDTVDIIARRDRG